MELYKELTRKHKNGGIPNLPAKIYSEYAEILLKPLLYIIKACLKSGITPNIFKVTNITAIPKILKPNALSDYRPISSISPIMKIIERFVVKHWIAPKCDENHFKDQFAFVPLLGRGYSIALALYNSTILEKLELNYSTIKGI